LEKGNYQNKGEVRLILSHNKNNRETSTNNAFEFGSINNCPRIRIERSKVSYSITRKNTCDQKSKTLSIKLMEVGHKSKKISITKTGK